MKKISKILLVLALCTITAFSLFGCKKNKEKGWSPPENYETAGKKVDGLDAYDIAMEGIENYKNAQYKKAELTVDFNAINGLAKLNSIETYTYRDGKMYYEDRRIGTGFGKANSGLLLYGDIKTQVLHEIFIDNSKKFPNLQTYDYSNTTWKSWAEINPEKSTVDKMNDVGEFTFYNLERTEMSSSFDPSVYKIGNDHYVCLKFNKDSKNQDAVRKVIENNLGATANSHTFKEETQLFLRLKQIDGKWFITARRLCEYSKVKHSVIGNAECTQYYSGTYEYGEDKATLPKSFDLVTKIW